MANKKEKIQRKQNQRNLRKENRKNYTPYAGDRGSRQQSFKKNNDNERKKQKEMEVNIPDSSVNKADLPDPKKKTSFDNAFFWYNHYPRYMENVSGVNYASPLGSGLRCWTSQDISNAIYSVPGICSIKYMPAYGRMDGTMRSAANRAATQLYAAMRIQLTSRADYDASDTMLYTIGMDSAYALYAYATKIYGVLNDTSPFNLYTMDAIARANGADPVSFRENLSQFRSLINYYALAISKRQVPADFDLFKRHTWMIQNMFTDAADAKAQIYTYVPDGYYVLEELTSGDKKLIYNKLVSADNGLVTYSILYNHMNTILTSLETSQDVDQMSADIYKAFKGNTLAAGLIPETYVTPVGYSAEVLSQIENCVLVGRPVINDEINANIRVELDLAKTNGPALIQDLWFKPDDGSNIPNSAAVCKCFTHYKPILNFHFMNVENQDTVVATRGTVTATRYGIPSGETVNCINIKDHGTEIYLSATYHSLDSTGSLSSHRAVSFMLSDWTEKLLSSWSAFDWAPALSHIVGLGGDKIAVYRYQDFDVYGVISQDQLEDIHYGCVLSEFYSDVYPEKVVNA